jgi:subtilisin family serine protease
VTAQTCRRWIAASVAALGLTVVTAAVATAESPGQAPVSAVGSAAAVPDQYIVVLRPGSGPAARGAARQSALRVGARIRHDYSNALEGFAGTLPAAAVEALRRNPNVASIEADQTFTVADIESPATWGLDRIDQRTLPLSNSYSYAATGAGVTAYIIDTGIRYSHAEFGGRAVTGFDAVDGGSADDCNGHGTHVAGTVGGSVYGVAKSVNLVGVRVLDCQGSGTTSGVIAGIDWVTGNHQAGQPAVANMSLGGGPSSALDTAVRNSIADGVTYAIAGGNDNTSACNSSPARVGEAITVGATTSADARASFSNYGTCLDLFAPGSSITSAWLTSDTATNTISGTSMATPHVAGAAALVLQGTPSASPAAVRDGLVNQATAGVVTNPGTGSPNRLLSTLTAVPPPPPPPGVCSGLPEQSTGSLSGKNDADIIPNGTYYQAAAGIHRGCLDGPAGVNFDLALYRWSGSRWVRVAVSEVSGPDESITYNGTAGYYYWRVYSSSGSGSYIFGMQRP